MLDACNTNELKHLFDFGKCEKRADQKQIDQRYLFNIFYIK